MMKRTTPLLLAAFLLAACGSSTEPSIDMDGKSEVAKGDAKDAGGEVCTPSCDGRECGTDGCDGTCGTCDPWLTCDDAGQCVAPACASSKDCPGELVCNESAGLCVVCVQDGDCDEGKTCGADHLCHGVVACTSDKDCKDYDMLCDLGAGICVQCLKSSHCAEEEHCLDTYCLPDVCVVGESWCEKNQVLACSDDGGAVGVVDTCSAEQYCEEAACQDFLCEPAAIWCDADVLKTCSGDGKAVFSEVDCSVDEQHCFDGQCIDTICEPSSGFCVDNFTVGTCSEDGMEITETACPDENYCDSGECFPWLCTPASSYCDGDVAKVCDAKGSAAVSELDCGALGKQCASGVCTDCQAQCEGKDCGDDGCGGECGQCEPGQVCIDGKCPPPGMDCDDGNEVDWDGCTYYQTSEYNVNSFYSAGGERPVVASFEDGRYVVVWQGAGPGDQHGVFAQRFGTDSNQYGVLLKANTYDAGKKQFAPAVAVLDDARFVAVWVSDGQDGSGWGVFGQVHDFSGDKIGEEFPVNSYVSGYQASPQVSGLPGGGFIVVWNSDGQDGSGRATMALLFDAAGDKIGEDFQVNTFTTGNQDGATVSAFDDGSCLVGWYSQGQDGDKGGIIGQFLDAEGMKVGDELLVNTHTAGWQQSPCALALEGGEAVMVWTNEDAPKAISARFYDTEGIPKGDEKQVNSSGAGVLAFHPRAAPANGGIVVVGDGVGFDGGEWGIGAQRLDSSGGKVGTELLVNTQSIGNQMEPDVAALPGGSFVVVWQSDDDDGAVSGIFAQRFDADCDKLYH